MNEVYEISKSLTDEQKRIADVWADGAGTVTPPGHWNTIAMDLVENANVSTLRSAPTIRDSEHGAGRRLHRLLGRQVRVLVAPACDGDTSRDPPQLALVHRDSAVPVVRVRPLDHLRRRLDRARNASFPKQAGKIAALADEAAISRLYAGIHYRSNNAVGFALGRRIGQVALHAYHADRGN